MASPALDKLYNIAAGAERVLVQRGKGPEDSQRKWWDGYRQALDDVSHLLTRE